MFARMFLALSLSVFFLPSVAHSWTYPYDGEFKQLTAEKDPWFFVDYERWCVKNPDKWQHFMGSYAAHQLLSKRMDKYLSGGIVMTLGVAKEIADAYREGYSLRDRFADLLGVSASLFNNGTYRLLCTYDSESVLLRLYLKTPF
ncbi:MAG: hypothetical protein AMJ41_02025 [candidate division Zixibacteria bacterium DG_27]|nr:MAG: hypothetical protein AMJ41_02025 [candidate division Zixibacteria bacterium DG_27]